MYGKNICRARSSLRHLFTAPPPRKYILSSSSLPRVGFNLLILTRYSPCPIFLVPSLLIKARLLSGRGPFPNVSFPRAAVGATARVGIWRPRVRRDVARRHWRGTPGAGPIGKHRRRRVRREEPRQERERLPSSRRAPPRQHYYLISQEDCTTKEDCTTWLLFPKRMACYCLPRALLPSSLRAPPKTVVQSTLRVARCPCHSVGMCSGE